MKMYRRASWLVKCSTVYRKAKRWKDFCELSSANDTKTGTRQWRRESWKLSPPCREGGPLIKSQMGDKVNAEGEWAECKNMHSFLLNDDRSQLRFGVVFLLKLWVQCLRQQHPSCCLLEFALTDAFFLFTWLLFLM